MRRGPGIDVPRAVAKLSRGELLTHFPHRPARRWGEQIVVIQDRSLRLIPYWLDQDIGDRVLGRLYPAGGIAAARVWEGQRVPVCTNGPRRRSLWRLPDPGATVLVLGDLGCLETTREGSGVPAVQLWEELGRRLRQNGNRTVALVPLRLEDCPRPLRDVWDVVAWELGASPPLLHAGDGGDDPLDRLLTLVSPVVRLEPGLLRDLRRLTSAGAADAGLEARLWQHPLVAGRHLDAASLDQELAKAYRERFLRESAETKRQVFRCIRRWRRAADGYGWFREVWFEEILPLPVEEAAWTLDEPGDHDDAVAFLQRLDPALPRIGPADPELSPELAWFRRATRRLPEHVWAASPASGSLQRLWREAHAHSHDPPPAGLHPAELVDEDRAVRSLQIDHVGGSLAVVPWQAAQVPSRGSLLAVVRARGTRIRVDEIELELDFADPAVFWAEGRAPEWASEWDVDTYGPWAELRVGDVGQRLRWVAAGTFSMGSPEDEQGRWGDEGPRHEVTLTQGFWLFDTPCTQALWEAVMGGIPAGSAARRARSSR